MTPILPPAEQPTNVAELVATYRATSDKIERRRLQTELLRRYYTKLAEVVRPFISAVQEDALIEAGVGFLHALEKFDPSRGRDFEAVADESIRREVARWATKALPTVRGIR